MHRYCLAPVAALVTACSLRAAPVKVIFDTDMCCDCDDVGALAILHKFADRGEAEILACVVNGHDQDRAAAACVDAVNTYYGRPQIPVGTYQGPRLPAIKSRYTARVRDEFPHRALSDDRQPRALETYRAALAAAPDASVTVISVGFLVNLAELLQSPPDTHSPLAGTELVARKVTRLVVMGGRFPDCEPGHGEFNFSAQGGAADTQYVTDHWPTPILFSGVEIGWMEQTGRKLGAAPAASPVRRAYEIYTSFQGRASWDLTAVLAAVRDPSLYWKVVGSGRCRVDPDGANHWLAIDDRHHSYLAPGIPSEQITELFDGLLGESPVVPGR